MLTPGSGTILPLSTFGVSRVRRACIAKGWQFTDAGLAS